MNFSDWFAPGDDSHEERDNFFPGFGMKGERARKCLSNLIQDQCNNVQRSPSTLLKEAQIKQPASEVAMTLIIPDKYYQKTSGLCSLSRSLISILNPLIATSLYSFVGLKGIIAVDICSFVIAFISLLLLVKIPENPRHSGGADC